MIPLDTEDLSFTDEAQAALDFLHGGAGNIFITGAAGTGKSTLIRHFLNHTNNQVVVLAPTGVAALNVNGQTIHSFFRFGLDITPDKAATRHEDFARLVRKVDTFVIDEASMVRADLMDCIDRRLRTNGRMPGVSFGGHHIVLVGDLYQLPPVVTQETEFLFESYYDTPYFFSSRVFARADLAVAELQKVYRQAPDDPFTAALARMRMGTLEREDLALINNHVREPRIVDMLERPLLAPRNRIIDLANQKCLATLPGRIVQLPGMIEGDFQPNTIPTSDPLILKEGAKVMTLVNHPDRDYVNGSMAEVVSLDEVEDGNIHLRVLETDKHTLITRHTWERIRYEAVGDMIVTEPVGKFTQFPLRLAYALTVHKSQGQTLSGAIITPGSGFFASGQCYVAFSRLVNADDLWLTRPLRARDIMADGRVTEFYERRVQRQMKLF